jgi:hypothetical protein
VSVSGSPTTVGGKLRYVLADASEHKKYLEAKSPIIKEYLETLEAINQADEE